MQEKVYFDTYRNRNGILGIILLSFLGLSGAALIGLAIWFKSGVSGIQVAEQDSAIFFLGLFGLGAGLLLIVVLLYLVGKSAVIKRKYTINEQRIVTTYKGQPESEISFEEMSQIYTYRLYIVKGAMSEVGSKDCLAYRKSSQDNWIPVVPSLKEQTGEGFGYDFKEEIIDLFLDAHLNKAYARLKKGEAIDFSVITFQNNNQINTLEMNMYFASSKDTNNKVSEKIKHLGETQQQTIRLWLDKIEIAGQTIAFEAGEKLDCQEVKISPVLKIGRRRKVQLKRELAKIITLYRSDSSLKFQIDTTYMINGELFEELLLKIFQQ